MNRTQQSSLNLSLCLSALLYILWSGVPAFGHERILSHQGVSVTVDFPGGEEPLFQKKEWLGEVVKNLVYFENEVLGKSWNGQSTSLYTLERKTEAGDQILWIGIRTASGKNFSFQMRDLDMGEDGFLRSFKLHMSDESEEYKVLNTQIDEKGDILERVIVLTRSLPASWIPKQCEEFVEGQWCVYSQYQDHRFTAYELKTFLLDMYGKRRFIHSRDGILSALDSRKIMEREIHESYSFSGPPPFKIVNLQMEEHGRITAFELMRPHFFEKESSREELHFDVRFLSYHGFGSLEKLTRLYQWKGGRKIFLSGLLSVNRLNRDVQVEEMRDTWFDIPPDREGLLTEERLPQREHIVFPDLSQTRVKTQQGSQAFFEEKERSYWIRYQPFVIDGKTEKKPVFDSIRDVRYVSLEAKNQKVNRIQVDYFDLVSEGIKLQKNRELTLDLLKVSQSGQPLEVQVSILSPEGESYVENFKSDCRYVIEQAIEGDLFVLKKKKSQAVVVDHLTSAGQIQSVWVYSLDPNTSPSVVTKVEKIVLVSEPTSSLP